MSLNSNIGLALLRIIPSALMLTHGFPKFQALVNQNYDFPAPLSGIGMGGAFTLVIAVLAEFFAPILVIVGFKTRWASLLTAATMAVAGFIVHEASLATESTERKRQAGHHFWWSALFIDRRMRPIGSVSRYCRIVRATRSPTLSFGSVIT